MTTNRKGAVLLKKFQAVAGTDRVSAERVTHFRTHGVNILAESETPAFGFKKIGLDLTDNAFKSVPANCAVPSVKMQGTAISESVIDTINLTSFKSFSEVITDDVLSWRRIPGKIKAYVGRGWDDKLTDAISEQLLKNMLYQMLIGGVKFDLREEAITAHSLVKYILAKPGASTLRTFFKHAGIDVEDRLAVYQAWSTEGVRDLITDIYAKNPYFNATSREVVSEYNRYVAENGIVDLAAFGASADIVEDSQEFSVFDRKDKVLNAMESFIGKKRGTLVGKAATRAVAEDMPERRRPSRYGNTNPIDLQMRRDLDRAQYSYCRKYNVSEAQYWRLFDAEFSTQYGVSIRQKVAEYRAQSGQIRISDYLRSAGVLPQALSVAERLSEKAAMGRKLEIIITPNFATNH